MTMTETQYRLATYVRSYAENYWPNLAVPEVTDDDALMMELRSDGYANAHVEGEHEANGLCSFKSARECGERMAASEFVETH
jgi:hypothetical protein